MNDINKKLNHLFCETISVTQKQGVQDGGSSTPTEIISLILSCQLGFMQSKLEQSKSHSKNKENLP